MIALIFSTLQGHGVAIPDYQSLMLPVLRLAGDGNEHRVSDVVEALAVQLKLTDAEREELLPKGKQPTFNNRVHWAKTYLVKAKLLMATRFAHFKITERGKSVLADNVQSIDKKFLTRFDEFNAFVGTVPTNVATSPDTIPKAAAEIAVSESTPDELLRE